MTICIAALADDGKSLILASDRKITYGFPINTEIESDNKKIEKITDKIFILSAGDSFVGSQLVEEIKGEQQGATSVKNVAEAARKRYIELRTKRMVQIYLEPRGMSLDYYLQKQKDLNEQISIQIDSGMSRDQQSFILSLIVGGIDDSGGHIYGIFHPGIMNVMDFSGFCAIGIGDVHAINSLIGNKYTSKSSLREVLYLVYDAKKRSEVAPGVGKYTDIYTIKTDGVHELTNTEIDELDKIKQELNTKLESDLKKALEDYKLAGKVVKEENANESKPTK